MSHHGTFLPLGFSGFPCTLWGQVIVELSCLLYYCCEGTSWPSQFIKESILEWMLAYSFIGLIHYYHGRKQASRNGAESFHADPQTGRQAGKAGAGGGEE